MEDTTVLNGNPTTSTTEGKTFTQEDVNRFVQERLARDREARSEAAATLDKREKELASREAAFQRQQLESQAKERLGKKGLPLDFMGLIDLSSPEAMERTISILEKNTPHTAPGKAMAQRMGGQATLEVDPIRRGMGLK
jgi:hypothetical protein